jgi:hypothetical protein
MTQRGRHRCLRNSTPESDSVCCVRTCGRHVAISCFSVSCFCVSCFSTQCGNSEISVCGVPASGLHLGCIWVASGLHLGCTRRANALPCGVHILCNAHAVLLLSVVSASRRIPIRASLAWLPESLFGFSWSCCELAGDRLSSGQADKSEGGED